jgi:hypothetical protein
MTKFFMELESGSVDTVEGWAAFGIVVNDTDFVEVFENVEGEEGYDPEYDEYRPVK